ncbi:helix-turn-helix domain-containing protein [Actinomycetospora termitidis]|uniref:Helix-turn-helix domain-containing protein n=1 Tax=Actinomycetospora termitidis TaxID=3053470 RepID=A0ABT7M6I3_9PSEU|nr:helix-turn-helix domain-containing protein [Actinomycetospora sp. Odt1-22]MDL5156280.1 helix-turn-helix domain-containing protein [Actinomycetospora sp. Odt1-22]
MTSGRVLDAARIRFRRGGRSALPPGVVREEIVASWERSGTPGDPPFVGHHDGGPLVAAADSVLHRFVRENPEAGCSVALVGDDGVVRVRYDTDPALGELLDVAGFVPGHRCDEASVGTTAASVAAHLGRAVVVGGAEHLHPAWRVLREAAAPVAGGQVVVVTHLDEPVSLAVARLLADAVADHGERDRRRRVLAVHDAMSALRAEGVPWVVAATGDETWLGREVTALPDPDRQALGDALTTSVLLDETGGPRHLDLPSGGCAEVDLREVRGEDGEVFGAVLAGGPVASHAVGRVGAAAREARRRQGSHVAPTGRRDFAADLRRDPSSGTDEARRRATQELFGPYERMRRDATAALGHRRHLLLVGETGVGKRTLARERFTHLFPRGTSTTVDCSGALDDLRLDPGGDAHLVLLDQVHALSPVAARRLDEALRPLTAMPGRVVVIGCLDSAAVDAGRPYGLLLRHFHDTVRVPALRHRSDELAGIAAAVLRSMSGARSLRLSHQVVRVLEGYAWPGNIAELEDVLRYVVARKPVGIVQPPDLPALCFTSAPRLTMLETAQADAIIHALYETRGNRYKAAAMLGIARSSLYRKIDAFGISYIA